MKLFVDTWGWLTLRDRRERDHQEVANFLTEFRAGGGSLQLVWITPKRFARARALRLKYEDKPDISFTDLSSIAVMAEMGIERILTGDAHFTHVGMGFELVPQ